MFLPYDVFHHIIKFADMKTLLQLYNTDQTIRQLCLKDPFMKVLVEFSKNQYFNLDATSTVLNDFLNDLCDSDDLKRLQLSFGACLIGKNINKQIIVLDGSSNGKWTFKCLIGRLLGDLYVHGDINSDNRIYRDTYIVDFHILWQPFNLVAKLKELSGGDSIWCKYDSYEPKFTTIVTTDIMNIQAPNQPAYTSRLNVFKFKSIYVNRPQYINEKIRIPSMRYMLLSDKNTIPALLNFLLQGCRAVLDK